MTRAALLDTSVVIDDLDGEATALDAYDSLLISSITYAELRMGLAAAHDVTTLRHRTRRLGTIERSFGPGLPFDDRAAIEYGRILEVAGEAGRQLRAHTLDRMIAATAAAHDLPLLTRNPADLRGLGDVVEVVAL